MKRLVHDTKEIHYVSVKKWRDKTVQVNRVHALLGAGLRRGKAGRIASMKGKLGCSHGDLAGRRHLA